MPIDRGYAFCPRSTPKPPLLRRLYRGRLAAAVLRLSRKRAQLDDNARTFDALDSSAAGRCAVRVLPVEVNRARLWLLRVPSARERQAHSESRAAPARCARRDTQLGVVMKRAQCFLTCGGLHLAAAQKLSQEGIFAKPMMAVGAARGRGHN